MSGPTNSSTLWSDIARHFSVIVEATEEAQRLPSQGELEEHWSRIQSYIESFDRLVTEKDLHDTDMHSISSYSDGPDTNDDSPHESSSSGDDKTIIQHARFKAGKAYTRSEDDLIWQTYKNTYTPESRRKAYMRVAKRLGRTYKGIITHVRDLCKRQARKKQATHSDSSRDSASATQSESSDQSSTDSSYSSVGLQPSQSNTGNVAAHKQRVMHGKGYLYTEEEDTDIWAAYLSTTHHSKRSEALRAVATQYDRTYIVLTSRLKKLLAAQKGRFGQPTTSAKVSDESGDSDACPAQVVHQVSDLSDSQSDSDLLTHQRVSTGNVSGNNADSNLAAHISPSTQLSSPHTSYPMFPQPSLHYSATSLDAENRLRVRAATPGGTPITFCGDTAKSLAYYRSTVSPAVYAPETVNEPLGRFVKSLRIHGLDLVFPVEAHDKMLCIILACFRRAQRHNTVNPYNNIFNAITSARNLLQKSFFHLNGVSNRKLHEVLKLLKTANCVTMTNVHGVIHLDPEIQSMAVLRRRHDRCLYRRMLPNDRAYLENLLLWPLDALAENKKIQEMESVMVKVERVLDDLAWGSKFSFLRA